MPEIKLSAHLLPSPIFQKRMGQLYGKAKLTDIDKMLDDLVGVDALSCLLTEAIETCQTKDGRIDMKDVAAYVLRRMKESPL